MDKSNSSRNSNTRANKMEESWKANYRPYAPQTQGQAVYLQMILNNPYVVCTGRAGTSKTYTAIREAGRQFKEGTIKVIVLVRPAVSQSVSLGFFKGGKVEKMMEWIRPMLDALSDEFCPSEIEYMITHDQLVFVPLETIKGNSFKDAFIIIDEAEDITRKELKTLMTRKGTNATMVICGDITQQDLHGYSGLKYARDLAAKYERFARVVATISFDEKKDVVRSEEVAEILDVFEEDEAAGDPVT